MIDKFAEIQKVLFLHLPLIRQLPEVSKKNFLEVSLGGFLLACRQVGVKKENLSYILFGFEQLLCLNRLRLQWLILYSACL